MPRLLHLRNGVHDFLSALQFTEQTHFKTKCVPVNTAECGACASLVRFPHFAPISMLLWNSRMGKGISSQGCISSHPRGEEGRIRFRNHALRKAGFNSFDTIAGLYSHNTSNCHSPSANEQTHPPSSFRSPSIVNPQCFHSQTTTNTPNAIHGTWLTRNKTNPQYTDYLVSTAGINGMKMCVCLR